VHHAPLVAAIRRINNLQPQPRHRDERLLFRHVSGVEQCAAYSPGTGWGGEMGVIGGTAAAAACAACA
jgi:hypothetical protein